METFGFTAGLLLSEAAGHFGHVTCYLTKESKFGALCKGRIGGAGAVHMDYFALSDEPSPPPDDLVAAFGAEEVDALTLTSFSPQLARSARPLLRLHGGGSVVLVNPLARVNPSTPCVIDVASPPRSPVTVLGGIQTGGGAVAIPWASDPKAINLK